MFNLRVENLYEASLTEAISSATGDITLKLTQAPVESFGGLVIDPSDSVKRETVIYHTKAGLNVSVYGVNRKNANTHLLGAEVKMLNIAELFNLMSSVVSWTFFTFQKSALDITVKGGAVAPTLTAVDTDITVANGTTYLYYVASDNTIRSTLNSNDITSNNGIKFATVVAGGGAISSITYERFVTGAFTLNALVDVDTTTPTDGQLLAWNETNNKWEPKDISISDLSDVVTTGKEDGFVLSWSAAQNKFIFVAQQASTSTPTPTGSTTTDEGTYWKTTYSDGSYTEYKTDGIYYFNSSSVQFAYEAKTGTYSTSGMTYTDGSGVDENGGITGGGNVAMQDRANIFTQTNQFKSGTLFDRTVYSKINTTTSSVDFSQTNIQKISISTATAFTFSNLSPGTTFGLFISASTGASISSITCTKVGGGSLATYCENGTLPDITSAGSYFLPIIVGDSAAHIYRSAKTLEV